MTTCTSGTTNAYSFEVDEETTHQVLASIVDRDGDAIPASSLVTLVATLKEGTYTTVGGNSVFVPGATVNSRDNQDILNTNNVTVDANGLLTWSVQTVDTEIVNEDTAIGARENHLMTITATTASDQVHLEVLLKVRNLSNVPQGG